MTKNQTSDLFPPADHRPVTNHSAGVVRPPRGLVPHVQRGSGSPYERYHDPASRASTHLWLSRDGRFEQYVSFDRMAWAQGGGDPHWISCMCEGEDDEEYTEVQIESLGELFRWGAATFGWALRVTDDVDGSGLGTHEMGAAAWGGSCCPGRIRADQRHAVVKAAATCRIPGGGQDRFKGWPLLLPGSRGYPVCVLQRAYNKIYRRSDSHPGSLPVTEKYDAPTFAAVWHLQEDQQWGYPYQDKVVTDGKCGDQTWHKIGWVLTYKVTETDLAVQEPC